MELVLVLVFLLLLLVELLKAEQYCYEDNGNRYFITDLGSELCSVDSCPPCTNISSCGDPKKRSCYRCCYYLSSDTLESKLVALKEQLETTFAEKEEKYHIIIGVVVFILSVSLMISLYFNLKKRKDNPHINADTLIEGEESIPIVTPTSGIKVCNGVSTNGHVAALGNTSSRDFGELEMSPNNYSNGEGIGLREISVDDLNNGEILSDGASSGNAHRSVAADDCAISMEYQPCFAGLSS